MKMAHLYQELAQLISATDITGVVGRKGHCDIQRTDRKAIRDRFHPYGVGLIFSGNDGTHRDPPSAYAESVKGPSYWPDFNRLPAIGLLSNEVAWQTNTLSQQNTLQSIHNVCSLGTDSNIPNFDRTLMSPASIPGQRQLEQDHPFYLRRRAAPAEGLTRTRDKYRVVYTEQQRKGLERAYEQNKFISIKTKMELAKELDLSDRQIKIWFQNRRAKERRQKNKESEDYKENHIPSREDSTLDAVKRNDLGNWSPMASEELSSCRFLSAAQTPPMNMHYFGKDQCGMKNKQNSSESIQFLSHSVTNHSSIQEVSPSHWQSAESGLLPHTNVSPLSFNLGIGKVEFLGQFRFGLHLDELVLLICAPQAFPLFLREHFTVLVAIARQPFRRSRPSSRVEWVLVFCNSLLRHATAEVAANDSATGDEETQLPDASIQTLY